MNLRVDKYFLGIKQYLLGLESLGRKGMLLPVILLLAACSNDPVPEEAIDSLNGFGDVDVTIKVGELAPDFVSTDASGEAVTLADYRGQANVMLVFYRGNWCPFCVSHLDDIQNLFPILEKYETQLLAISPDDAKASQKLAKKFDQPYRFVADVDLTIADLYGVRRDEKIPHPAVVLIDKQGVVVWYYAGENYKQRPSSEQLQRVIEQHL